MHRLANIKYVVNNCKYDIANSYLFGGSILLLGWAHNLRKHWQSLVCAVMKVHRLGVA